jgi:transposase-like protein
LGLKEALVDLFEQSGASLADVALANNLKVDFLRQWVNQARIAIFYAIGAQGKCDKLVCENLLSALGLYGQATGVSRVNRLSGS